MPSAARPRPPLDAARSALVLVDYQQRLMPAIHEAERVLAEAARLADVARAIAIPILATEQNPRGLGPNAPEISRRCDATVAKMSFDACADGLAREIFADVILLARGVRLRAPAVPDPHCVLRTSSHVQKRQSGR